MTGTPNKPLNPFRRQESASSKPLHSRWGDVAITVPTEGSWSQYNNPHRRSRKYEYDLKGEYGPGHGSEHSVRRHRHRHLPSDEEVNKSTTSNIGSPASSSSRRTPNNQRNISLRRRLSLNRRSTEPTSTEEANPKEKEPVTKTDFAYKPINQDYPTEIAENQGTNLRRANTARFRYIPASARYREEFGEIPERSPSRSKGSSVSEEKKNRCREGAKRASVVSSLSLSSTSTSSSASKRLTTAMVPDAEDIYG